AGIGVRRTGRGAHVDLSLLEVVHLSMAPFTTVVASFGGPSAAYGRTVEIPSIEPVADGWVGFCTITNQQWRDFLVLVERGDLVDDPGLAHYFTREPRAGWASRPPPSSGDGGGLPFTGLRVLDFTMFWAGPFVGHFLAVLGADVVKVESIQRPDGIRLASTQQPAAERWWGWSAMYHGSNAGKPGITLDLS